MVSRYISDLESVTTGDGGSKRAEMCDESVGGCDTLFIMSALAYVRCRLGWVCGYSPKCIMMAGNEQFLNASFPWTERGTL